MNLRELVTESQWRIEAFTNRMRELDALGVAATDVYQKQSNEQEEEAWRALQGENQRLYDERDRAFEALVGPDVAKALKGIWR